ncbi:MAG TPA: HEAT repeat domain-containing protein [Vicinamibacterales bacterium]|nr:HEAT repeat domain-containing protein [Vicinamibacterales bacterium]
MKRVLMFVAIVVLLPMAVAAQVPPTPPTPPTPPAPPAPVVAPVPPLPPIPARAPRAIAAPTMMEPWELEQALRAASEAQRAAQEAQRVNVDVIREATRAAQEARAQVEHDFRYAAPMAFDFRWDYMDHQPFGQESSSWYNSCRSLQDQREYEKAITSCDRYIAQKGPRTDGALYWKAYAQFRLGKRDEAVASIGQLRKEYPQSRYLKDAQALEVDVKGTRPEDIQDNDEIKLLAINAMKESDPERAVPLLDGLLNKANSLRVKRGALSVLAQINNPRAHQILLNYAKGAGNPDLQMEAIRHIAIGRDKQTTSAELRQIYEATDDVSVRAAIIGAYQSAGNKTELVRIAGTESTPVAIRGRAISGLTNIAAPQELWALYQKETDKNLKIQMVQAFASMGALDQLTQILKTEKDPEVRRRVIRSLGSLRSEKTGQMLVDMYSGETDLENRKAVISALGSQENAEALVAIARKETNLPLKTDIVRKLSDMAPRSKVAADFMLEILK